MTRRGDDCPQTHTHRERERERENRGEREYLEAFTATIHSVADWCRPVMVTD